MIRSRQVATMLQSEKPATVRVRKRSEQTVTGVRPVTRTAAAAHGFPLPDLDLGQRERQALADYALPLATK